MSQMHFEGTNVAVFSAHMKCMSCGRGPCDCVVLQADDPNYQQTFCKASCWPMVLAAINERRDSTQESVAGLSALKAPAPETRIERLVVTMLRAEWPHTFSSDDARKLVGFARCIETELDSAGANGGIFLTRRFADRDTFVQWLLRGLSYARERMKTEGIPTTDFNIGRAAKYLADWVDE